MDERGTERGARPLGSFAPATLRRLLAAVRGGSAESGWPSDAVVERLLRHVLEDREMAAIVEAALVVLLGADAETLAAARPYDLALAWPARLGALDRRPAAALLWAVARRPEAVFRKLEARFVADLERAAARAWLARRGYASGSRARAAMRPRKPAGTDSWRRGSSIGRTRSSAAISHGGSGTSSSS